MELLAPIQQWFLRLYETTGVNLTIFYDSWDGARYVEGIGYTLMLATLSILISLVLGIVGAGMQMSRWRAVRAVVYTYVQIFRNTPPLAQLYFLYFGIGSLMPRVVNASGVAEPMFNNIHWAIISLSLFAGAFNVEIFRSGIEAVPHSTVEATKSLGYSRVAAYRHVIFPLALRICLPSLGNNLVNLVKTTSIAYAIAVPEVLYVANQIWTDNLNVTEMMNVVLVTYLTLVGFFVLLFKRWERWLRIPGHSV
ncbi:MAG: amino acid ABC transporter permease [Comamonadaceae bacterium]|nr:amino acid ABC transporter permease [Comamonadaceae bacterium]